MRYAVVWKRMHALVRNSLPFTLTMCQVEILTCFLQPSTTASSGEPVYVVPNSLHKISLSIRYTSTSTSHIPLHPLHHRPPPGAPTAVTSQPLRLRRLHSRPLRPTRCLSCSRTCRHFPNATRRSMAHFASILTLPVRLQHFRLSHGLRSRMPTEVHS